ncbi:MAG: TonB-dependent receptor [Rhodothermaceae bacterium]|nr:TonB-dependent receptor [Rhodothermaceae bacterium]
MRSVQTYVRSIGIAFLIAFCIGQASNAQSIQLDFEQTPLPEALNELRMQLGLDFIYAVRLVKDEKVTCNYKGNRLEVALSCVFDNTPIRVQQLHQRQYILSSDPSFAENTAQKAARTKTFRIDGYVLDRSTKKPLPGAHIYLPVQRQGTVSDPNGQFYLDKLRDSEHLARISFLGYQALDTLLTASSEPLSISLRPTALEAENITVEGDLNDSPNADLVAGMVSMRGQELDEAPRFGGERDLLQTLQNTPGVYKAGVFNNGILVRGGFSDQNLYLIDGAPIYHPWHAFNLISTFHADAFEDIKFYKGAFPAEHGGRLSSVLDARLKDGRSSAPTARVGMSVLSGRFIIESPLTRNSSFMIAGRRSYIDKLIGSEHPVQDANGTRDTLRTGYHFSDITAKLSVTPNKKNILSVSYYSGNDILDLKLPFNLSLDFNSWLRPAELFFEVDHDWGNRLYTFQHQAIPSSKVLITNTLYRSSYNAKEAEFVQPTSSSSLSSKYRVRVRDIGFRSDITILGSDQHQSQGGFHLVDHQFDSSIDASIYRSEGARDSLVQESSLDALEIASYAQHSWIPSPTFMIQPGVRISYFSSGSHLYLSPRLNVRKIVHPDYLTLNGSVGSQVQYLQRLRDRYSFMYDLVSSRWVPTSEDLNPSRSFQVSFEAASSPYSWLDVSVESYWRSSKNVLIPRDVFQQKDGIDGPGIEVASLLSQYTPGLSRAYGVEISTLLDLQPWRIALDYSGAKSKNRAPLVGDTEYHPSLFDVPRLLRGSVTRSYSDWYFTLSSTFRSGYPITVPVAAYTLGGPGDVDPTRYLYRPEYNNGRLPPYIRVDLTIAYFFEMLGADWTTQLHIFNLTNRRNVIDRYYEPTPNNVEITQRKGLPILPLFEIEMDL